MISAAETILDYVDAHAASGTFDGTHRALELETVQVGHLDLGDLFHLLLRDLADLRLVRLGRTFGEVHGALDQHRNRRRFGDEGERTVGVNGDYDRDDQAL